jgi:cysteine desulfurase
MTTTPLRAANASQLPEGLRGGLIYLDYNATTPVDPRVVEAMLPYLTTHFGNPSSAHGYGRVPHAALGTARARIAALINARADEVAFMGSGSEADATAIRGIVTAARRSGVTRPHVITQATEHPAVLSACAYAERHHGTEITVLDVDHDGLVDPADLVAALRPETVLVSVMHANNETGVIQPIAELARVAHDHGAVFHTDAAQSSGKIPVDVGLLGVDLLTVVGHKMYAPKGIAALYVRAGVDLEPLVGGGGQERGRRAGTENVAGAVAFGVAAELARGELAAGSPGRLQVLRDALHRELEARLPGRVELNGARSPRLPQTLNVSIRGIEGHVVLASCALVAASTGSACHSGDYEPSPVLSAMGLSRERGLSAVRLTLGRWTTQSDVTTSAAALVRAVQENSD